MSLIKAVTAGAEVILYELLPYSIKKYISRSRQRKIVHFARMNSPYYKRIIPEGETFEDIPLSTKADVMECFNDVLTDSRITSELIWNLLSNGSSQYRIFDKYNVSCSSGTTGEPMICVQDSLFIHRGLVSCLDLCVFPCATICYDGFGIMNSVVQHGVSGSRFLNRLTRVFSNLQGKEALVEALNKFKPRSLCSYASVIEMLTDYVEDGSLCIHPKSILLTGEHVSEETRKRIKSVFKDADVRSNYASTETGPIAYECKHGHLHIKEDLVKIEPLDEEGNVLGFEVESTRIAVTSFSNYIQPVIRYILEDKIIVHEKCACGNKSPWIEVKGRTNSELVFRNKKGDPVKIAPLNLVCLSLAVSEDGLQYFTQYQIVLHPGLNNLLEFRLALRPGNSPEVVMNRIRDTFAPYLAQFDVTAEYVLSDKAPEMTSKNGKMLRVFTEKAELE